MVATRRISRRHVLQNVGLVAASGLVAGRGGTRAAQERPENSQRSERPRVLALIGDRYHNADYIRVALRKLFRELDLPVTYTFDYAEISPSYLGGFRLFVCLRDGMIWPGGYLEPSGYGYARELENPTDWPDEKSEPWITEEQGRAIKEFVLAGNGLYALHNSSNISLYSKEFRDVMGGAYIGHPPLRPFRVRIVDKVHPITHGVEDFVVNDEQHYVTYDKDPQHVILRSENLDGLRFENMGAESIAGWAYDFGKGRVVFTAVGHTIHALWQPEYFKIQRNAMRWLLRIL